MNCQECNKETDRIYKIKPKYTNDEYSELCESCHFNEIRWFWKRNIRFVSITPEI
jgi:hypothetical protein